MKPARWLCVVFRGPIGLLLAAVMVASAGCNKGDVESSSGGNDSKTAGEKTAASVLDDLCKAYASAYRYHDQATLELKYTDPEGAKSETARMHVSFERPNRLRYQREGILIVSDGKMVYGKPDELDGQVVVISAPRRIEIPAFYEIVALEPLVQPTIGVHSIQLDLLLAKAPLKEIRAPGVQRQLLPPERADGQICDRVQIATNDSELVLWVDQQSHTLRRVDYPTESLLAEQGVGDVRLTLTLTGAELDPKIDKRDFQWNAAKDEIQVRSLVMPPAPPHDVIGKVPGAFTLKTEDGVNRDSRSWDGKITVVDFWATWCPECLAAMPKFTKAYQPFADNDEVQFVALSIDDATKTDAEIKAQIEAAGGAVPWARVVDERPAESTSSRFQLNGIPAYVILDKQGRVQFHHVGGGSDTQQELNRHINQLLAGHDFIAEAEQDWRDRQQRYLQQIQLMRIDDAKLEIELTPSVIAQHATPKSLLLRKRWTNSDAKIAGNIHVITDTHGDARQFVVIDGYRTFVTLGTDGTLITRHDDLLPPQAVATFVRSGVRKDGQRLMIVGGSMQPRFYVFDEQWKFVLAYPEADTTMVYDVLPTDLDANGSLELCVGYAASAGIHGVELDGRRIWRNRSMGDVLDLATAVTADGKRNVLCAHSYGSIVPIDQTGKAGKPIEIPNQSVTQLAAADLNGDGQSEIAAVTVDISLERRLVGLSSSGNVQWEQPLPAGGHEVPLDSIVAANWFSGQPGRWLVATADGVIHFISHDGKQLDRFATGRQITGMNAARSGDTGLLLISNSDGVTAFEVDDLPAEDLPAVSGS